MPGWIGPWEIAILLLIVLLVFGPKRLPELGKSLGRGMREFKNSIKGGQDEADEPAELPVKSETDEKVSTPSDRST
jgi:sec-independent protein translocase protein TatA